jgi:hypothetical protein
VSVTVARAIAAASVACLLLAAGCGDDDDGSATGDDSGDDSGGGTGGGTGGRVCDTLEGFDSTVDEITGAEGDGDATVADIQEALDEFQADLEEVQNDDETELPEPLEAGLQAAASGLESLLDDLPSEEILSETSDAVASARSSIGDAWVELLDALDCPSPDGSTTSSDGS